MARDRCVQPVQQLLDAVDIGGINVREPVDPLDDCIVRASALAPRPEATGFRWAA
jgi:hypothetical protein